MVKITIILILMYSFATQFTIFNGLDEFTPAFLAEHAVAKYSKNLLYFLY